MVGVVQTRHGKGLLFLTEGELRSGQDLLFFASRDFNRASDEILADLGFGRAHYRCLHWVNHRSGLTIGELLEVLGITKQSLSRVLGPLIQLRYVAKVSDELDRRRRFLMLTEKGKQLERKLFEAQREKLLSAYREAGEADIDGFKCVLRGLIGEQGRDYLRSFEDCQARRTVKSSIRRPSIKGNLIEG
jgi:DNA-binding MarR family transcriptional regulator